MKENTTPTNQKTQNTTASITTHDLVKALEQTTWYNEERDEISTGGFATINLYGKGTQMANIGMTMEVSGTRVKVHTYYWKAGMEDDDPEEYYHKRITPSQATKLLNYLANSLPEAWGIDAPDNYELKELTRDPDGSDINPEEVERKAEEIYGLLDRMEELTNKKYEHEIAELNMRREKDELDKLLGA